MKGRLKKNRFVLKPKKNFWAFDWNLKLSKIQNLNKKPSTSHFTTIQHFHCTNFFYQFHNKLLIGPIKKKISPPIYLQIVFCFYISLKALRNELKLRIFVFQAFENGEKDSSRYRKTNDFNITRTSFLTSRCFFYCLYGYSGGFVCVWVKEFLVAIDLEHVFFVFVFPSSAMFVYIL